MISLEFKSSNFFDINNLKVLLILLNDISFSLILYIWFILYKFGVITSISPFFGLLVGLIQNIITISYLFKNGSISKDNIIRYLFILLILKIIPLLTFLPDNLKITYKDIIYTVYLYVIYIAVLLIIKEIFDIKKLNINHTLKDDLTGERYKDEYSTKIYDFTYEKIISKIFE